MLEATVPNEALDAFPALLDGLPVVQCTRFGPADPGSLVRVLVDATDAEAVSDRLAKEFGGFDGFRVNLLSVEATSPPLPPEDDPPAEAEGGETAAADETEGPKAVRPSRLRVSREELYDDLCRAARPNIVYIVMVALSTVVAAVGLLRDDVAIVIGAMVIAPLLGPNVALSLAVALGDKGLVKTSLSAIAAGVGIAALVALVIGFFVDVDPSTPALLARSNPGPGDILLGLSAGAAGALAFTTGVPAVVVGVMVAVALLPPLVTAGLLAGSGFGVPATGALTLCLANVTCINLSAMATFYIQDVRPRTWWEKDRARRGTRRAMIGWVIMFAILAGLILFAPSGWAPTTRP
ncbi:TIGR00341 family protein [Marinihelvus fidelis]|nr:TIGR00341 family protein [Marinihelvus fidelis]